MNFLRPFTALLHGIRLCLFNPSVRKHAKWPVLVGTFTYPAALYGAYQSHATVLGWLVSSPEGVWKTVLYWLAWLLTAALLFVGSFIVTVCLVMVFTSVFQSAIAQAVIKEHNPDAHFPDNSLIGEAARTILVESTKLIWLLPLIVLVFFVGFIPLFAPVALILGAWLLAYQFVDVVLDLFHVSARKRFRFGRIYFRSLVMFGLALTLCWAIPFLGIFLAPAATAGAAWLLSEEPYLESIKELSRPS